MYEDRDVTSIDFSNLSQTSRLANKFILKFFTIDDSGILSPTKHYETMPGCFQSEELYRCGWFSVIPISLLRSFLISCLPEEKRFSRNYFSDREKSKEYVSGLYVGLLSQLKRLGIKNPYIAGEDYLLISTVPVEKSDIEENFPHGEIRGIYKPKLNGGNVFGISVDKKLDGKYSSLILFNNLADAVDFRNRLNAFYNLANCNNVLNVEYYNLNDYYKPLVYSTNKFSFSDRTYLENGINIDIVNEVQEYHFQKDENISVITADYSLDFMNDVFHYSSFGQEYYPGKLLTKIINETEFDFTNVVVERDKTGRLLYLINFKNGRELNIDVVADQGTDHFISIYYNAITAYGSKFIAVDIWDLAKKYYEFIKFNRDTFNHFIELDYFNIGIAYYYLERYINKSVSLKIIRINGKQIVASSIVGGKHIPVELQAFQDQDDTTSIIGPNLVGLEPDHKFIEEVSKMKAVRLNNVYLKNTFFKVYNESKNTFFEEYNESKNAFYINTGVAIIGIDKTQIHELDEIIIERLNRETVYVRSDGTLMPPFENGKLTCPTTDLYFNHFIKFNPFIQSRFDSFINNIHYRRLSRLLYLGSVIGDDFESLKLTKIYRPEDLITMEELYKDALKRLKLDK